MVRGIVTILLGCFALGGFTQGEMATVSGRLANTWDYPISFTMVSLQMNDSIIQSTAADYNGTFSFKNISSGKYKVTCVKEGYFAKEEMVVVDSIAYRYEVKLVLERMPMIKEEISICHCGVRRFYHRFTAPYEVIYTREDIQNSPRRW